MDTTPKLSLAIAKKVLEQLHALNLHVKQISEELIKNLAQPKIQKEQGEKKSTHRNVHVESIVPVDLAEDFKQEYRTANQQNTTNSSKQLLWAKISAGLIFLYAVITFFMYRANNKSAKAAADANIAVQTINRAYVSFGGVSARRVTSRTTSGDVSRMLFVAQWQNGGNTPATAISYFRIDPMSHEPDGPDFLGNGITSFPSNVLQPRSNAFGGPEIKTTSVIFGDFLSKPASKILTQKSLPVPVYAWGWMAYRDAFGGTEPHITEFCNTVAAIGIRQDNGDLEITWGLCSRHNCIDKNCPDYDSIAKLTPQLVD